MKRIWIFLALINAVTLAATHFATNLSVQFSKAVRPSVDLMGHYIPAISQVISQHVADRDDGDRVAIAATMLASDWLISAASLLWVIAEGLSEFRSCGATISQSVRNRLDERDASAPAVAFYILLFCGFLFVSLYWDFGYGEISFLSLSDFGLFVLLPVFFGVLILSIGLVFVLLASLFVKAASE